MKADTRRKNAEKALGVGVGAKTQKKNSSSGNQELKSVHPRREVEMKNSNGSGKKLIK